VSRIRTVLLGSGGFGGPALRRLVAHPDVDLVGVVTAPDRPVGRRAELTPSPVGALAASLGIGPVLSPDRLRTPEAISAVLDLRPGLAVLADYGQLVPAPLLRLDHGALNLHPSLLPRHRGATPIPAAILHGDVETGVSLFAMDAGLDSGPIVAARPMPLTGAETAPELEERLAEVAGDLLDSTLGPWIRGEIVARPQDESAATMTRLLRRDDGRLDPTLPAHELERRVRAYLPWPGSFMELPGFGRLIVRSAIAAAGEPGDEPGTLVADGDGLAVATPEGRLRLGLVQLAGRRLMDASTARRGAPGLVGARVR
jgi:methionyl-tRNA formyltransferase